MHSYLIRLPRSRSGVHRGVSTAQHQAQPLDEAPSHSQQARVSIRSLSCVEPADRWVMSLIVASCEVDVWERFASRRKFEARVRSSDMWNLPFQSRATTCDSSVVVSLVVVRVLGRSCTTCARATIGRRKAHGRTHIPFPRKRKEKPLSGLAQGRVSLVGTLSDRGALLLQVLLMHCKVGYGILDGGAKKSADPIPHGKDIDSVVFSGYRHLRCSGRHRFCGYRHCCRYLSLRKVYRGLACGHMGVLVVG